MDYKTRKKLEELKYTDPTVRVIEDENGKKVSAPVKKQKGKITDLIDFPISPKKTNKINMNDFVLAPLPKTSISEKILSGIGQISNGLSTDNVNKYINDEDYRAKANLNAMVGGSGVSVGKWGDSSAYLNKLTDKQKQTYNNLYEKEGKKSANKYLNTIRPDLEQDRSTDIFNNLKDKPAIVQLIHSIPTGFDQFASGISNLGEDDYKGPSAIAMTAERLKDENGGAFDTAFDVSSSISNMVPSIVATTVTGNPLVGTGVFTASATGNYYKEAVNLGYDKEQARNYALLSGASEGALQYFLGGISKLGGKATGKIFSNSINNINNALLQTSVKLGKNAIAEGSEEYLQDILNPLFKNIALDENNELKLFSKDALYSGLVGALTAGLLEGGGTAINTNSYNYKGKEIINNKADTGLLDYALNLDTKTSAYKIANDIKNGKLKTNPYNIGELFAQTQNEINNIKLKRTSNNSDVATYTQNEQNVIDSIAKEKTVEAQKEKAINEKVSQLISEKESTFGTLNNTEKQNIKNKVMQQLDSGDIDFTKATLSKKEISKINEEVRADLEKGNISIESIENTLAGSTTSRIKALNSQLEQTTNAEEKEQIQAQINELKISKDNELMSMLKNDTFLQKSYQEASLKAQKFSYEAQEKDSDYKKKLADEFTKKANNSTKSKETFEMLSKLADDRQAQYHITNNDELAEMGYSIEGKTINGLVNKNGEVLINIDANNAINRIVGHETTHLFEGTQEHTELKEMAKQNATTKGEYETRLKEVQRLYKGTNANVENEITSDLVGDYLFTDTDFINNLSTEKPNIFKKIYEEVKHLYKLATAGSKEARELEKVKKAFDKAYKNTTAKSDGEVKYSINPNFTNEYDKWDKKIKGFPFNIGTTSEVLQGIGIDNKKIYWDSSKIIKIKKDHPAMSDRVIKQVPNILENPIMVMESKTVAGRVTLFGEVYDENNVPVLAVIELNPTDKGGKSLDIIKVASAYGKETNPQLLINQSRIMYIDPNENRTHNWLSFNRLKLPLHITNYGFINTTISQDEDGVNNSISKNSENSDEFSLKDSEGNTLTKEQYQYLIEFNKNSRTLSNGDTAKNSFARENSKSTNTNIAQDKVGVNNSISNNPANSVKMSLENPDTQIAPTKNDIFGSDIKYQGNNADTATGEDLAPVRQLKTSQNIALIKETPKPESVPAQEKESVPIKIISKDEADRLKQENLEKLGTKSNYLTEKSDQLYSEIKGLRKGIKASEELSYMLDFGFNWSDIKSTLLNIKFHPDNVVNKNSEVESIIREVISRDYDSQYEDIIYANYEISADDNITVRESNKLKAENYNNLLNKYEQEKGKSKENFNKEITKKLNEYDRLKNKNTKKANNILQQIENLKTRRDNIQVDYDRKTKTATKKLENIKNQGDTPRISHAEVQRGYIDEIKQAFNENGYDFDEVLKNAKRSTASKMLEKSSGSTVLKVLENASKVKEAFSSVDNTPQRFVEKTFGYKEGQILNDLTTNRTALNESEGIKWINSYKNKKNGKLWELSREYDIKPNSKEDAAAQMYAEGFYVADNNDIIAYSDAELAKDFPDVDTQNKIKSLSKDPKIRQIYDETLDAINESRVRNGYPPVPRRNDYFLHFRAMNDTFSELGIPFNPNDIRAKDLPTDINGMTADLKPGQPYFASANKRMGIRTSFSLLGGMDRYLSSAKNQIYHIDDIQTLRGLRNYVADMFGQAKGLSNLDSLTEAEQEQRVKEVYDNHLSTFAKFVNEQANILAGKTALVDRGIEGIIGRQGITFIDTVRKQVGKNMIGFNLSSSLTNLISAIQATAKLSKYDAIKGFAQTTSNGVNKLFGRTDGFAENDPTMIRRKGEESFYQTPYEKVSNVGYQLMTGIDNVVTEYILRAKNNELTRKGMDSQKAQIEAGKWAMRILADRSLGQQPQIFNSKTLGPITQFQVEVRNQLDSQFYDTIQEAKLSTEEIENGFKRNAVRAAKITSTLTQLAVFQHLFGVAFESIAGYNPAFDIISVILTAFGYDDDEDSEDTTLDNVEQALLELSEQLPYSNLIFGGGRFPISNALPPIKNLIEGKDSYGNDKAWYKTLGEALPYYVLPGGYGQIKKAYKGLKMFDEDLPVSGSYTDSGNLRFPVEDTVQNRIQAGLFGQYANENARSYFDNGRAPLKKKQIEEFKELDIPIGDYWKYRSGLKDKDKLNEKFDYIDSMNVSDKQKNIMVNNVVDRKKPVDMSNYSDFGSYEEFDFATKNKDKHNFFQSNGISYKDYSKSDESREAYNWAFNNPEMYAVSNAVTNDVVAYRQYASDLNELKADKDNGGSSISGSRKSKVVDYINGLDADYGAKLILYKTEYSSDDSINNDIIEYLNNREDIDYQQMQTILTKLGMTVDQDGNIMW